VGTNVELWLPVTNEAPSAAEIKEETTDPREGGLVLLVDDESVARRTTADMLSDLGFAVTEAKSGEEALSMLRRGHAPDIMISDHLMPGITGEELVREAQILLPEMRVLIVSGFAGLDEISPDIPRLNKPFRQAELASTISRLVSDGEH